MMLMVMVMMTLLMAVAASGGKDFGHSVAFYYEAS